MKVKAIYIVIWKGKNEILYSTATKFYVTESGKLVAIPDNVAWELYD